MTSTTIQQELNRLDGIDPRVTLHLEALLCAARLHEAIDRAERWYARREDVLHRFDQRAAATVRKLVADARVRPSLAWPSA